VDHPLRGAGEADDFATAVAVAPNGAGVVVTGWTATPTTAHDGLVLQVDAATGERRRVATYDGPDHVEDKLFGVAFSPDGHEFAVTGSSQDADGSTEALTLLYRV
jgi:hypothetical protein